MKLTSEECTNKFKQDGGVKVMVIFRSVDRACMHMEAMEAEQAEKFTVGTFYEFSATEQKTRD